MGCPAIRGQVRLGELDALDAVVATEMAVVLLARVVQVGLDVFLFHQVIGIDETGGQMARVEELDRMAVAAEAGVEDDGGLPEGIEGGVGHGGAFVKGCCIFGPRGLMG